MIHEEPEISAVDRSTVCVLTPPQVWTGAGPERCPEALHGPGPSQEGEESGCVLPHQVGWQELSAHADGPLWHRGRLLSRPQVDVT